jgi:hypothetical protein
MKAASGFEKLTEVTPDMFEDISDVELAKFDKYLVEMDEIVRNQNEILAEIRVSDSDVEAQHSFSLTIFGQTREKQFLDSRRDDPTVKERENALQSLDLAYFKYKEITRNLDEGFKVHLFTICGGAWINTLLSFTTIWPEFLSNSKKCVKLGVSTEIKKYCEQFGSEVFCRLKIFIITLVP